MTTDTSLLHQEQVEMLTQIGTYLRQVREESLLSLEEVAAKTLIQARLLQAIETGKLHQLPEPVYIQGFIKRYADALGLNGTEFADAFPTEGTVRVPQSSWKDSPAAQLRPLHLYVAYIALIMASVSLLSYVVNRSAPLASTLPRTVNSVPTVSPTTPAASPGASSNPTNQLQAATRSPAASPAATPQKPVRVAVKLTSQSWLQVEADGKLEFEGVLSEGTEKSWTADSQLRMRSGNAGAVLVSYNGSQAKKMGEMGAVEEITFAPSQDSASLPNASITVPTTH